MEYGGMWIWPKEIWPKLCGFKMIFTFLKPFSWNLMPEEHECKILYHCRGGFNHRYHTLYYFEASSSSRCFRLCPHSMSFASRMQTLKKGPPCKEETVHFNLSHFVVNLCAVITLHSCLITFTFYLSILYDYLCHCHIAWRFWIYCMQVVIIL